MTDIIIIGAGTAGLTAGIYAARAGKSALILESTAYGGQIINTPDIENYRVLLIFPVLILHSSCMIRRWHSASKLNSRRPLPSKMKAL